MIVLDRSRPRGIVIVVTKWLALVVSALTLVAGASGAVHKEREPLFGLLERAGRDDLIRIDPGNLRPVGERLDVGEFGHGWAFSRDRVHVALGVSSLGAEGRTPALRIIDLRAWRPAATIALPGRLGLVRAVSWVSADRVLVLVAYPRSWDVVAVDTAAGRIVGRTTLERHVLHVVPTLRGLTLLTAPLGEVGQATVELVDSRLRTRAVSLDRITAGFPVSGSIASSRLRASFRRALSDGVGARRRGTAGDGEPACADRSVCRERAVARGRFQEQGDVVALWALDGPQHRSLRRR